MGSQRTIADVFGVSLAFVEKVLRQYRTTGSIAPKPHAGGQKPRLDATAQAIIRRLVSDHPDETLQELGAGVAAETGVRVSVATMCRVLGVSTSGYYACATPHASSKRGRSIARRSQRSTSGA